jgi:ribosomal protein S18 acetylase RimI-like enzyme
LPTLLNYADLNDVVSFVDTSLEATLEASSNTKNLPFQIVLEQPTKYLKEVLLGSGNRKIFGAKLVDDAGIMSGTAVVERSDWDSGHFGLGVGKLKLAFFDRSVKMDRRTKLFRLIKDVAPSYDVDVIFARVSLNDLVTIHSLEASGGVMADILLTFYIDLSKSFHSTRMLGWRKLGIDIDHASRLDETALMTIARAIFKIDHFHADPRLQKEKCNELYAKWASNSLKGLAETVFVARKNGDIVGFVSCKIQAGGSSCSTGLIDLVGVRSEYACCGIGCLLVSKALSWFSKRASLVTVGTQAANVPAVRLYQKMGFKHISSEATLHLWTT